MTGPIRFLDLAAQRRRLGPALDTALARVIAHGQFIMGPEVAELEGRLAAFAGAAHCVSCASGTDALLLPLMAWGIGRGDAVLVPSFTFAATAEVVCLLGATPVFVDVEEDGFNMAASSLERGIGAARAAGLVPRAVVPVDLYGRPADYPAIAAIAAREGLHLLADAAQSFGASLDNRRVGALAPVTATSFFPAKPLGCYGDGGAVFTDDGDLAALLRSLRVHGQGAHKYDTVRVGLNSRLDTLQAAVLLEKLAIFPDELGARRRIAARYTEALAGAVVVPRMPAGIASAWACYTIRVGDRGVFAAKLGAAGIPTSVYYPVPLHRQPAFNHFPRAGELPVSERLAEEVLSLPIHPDLDDDAVDAVIAEVLAAAGARGAA